MTDTNPSTARMLRSFGHRLLPKTLDELAGTEPNRLYASIQQHPDNPGDFLDVTVQDMAHCANFMASWIRDNIGVSDRTETLCYLGISDLRGVAVFFGAVKCGFKLLLPSPRNPAATNFSLMQQTGCTKVLHTADMRPLINQIKAQGQLESCEIPSFDQMLASENRQPHIPYDFEFEEVKNRPILVLHSSGSTGFPKPITMTHASFAVIDNDRNLPTVAGRKNRDFSTWNFPGGGRFYTVFPFFHVAGFLTQIFNPVFSESSSPVLGPPGIPPDGDLLIEVMKHQKLRALFVPPSLIEHALQQPGSLELFRKLDFVSYTGGPLSETAGASLTKVTQLYPLFGMTEAFQVPQLLPEPEDWVWMEWNPHYKCQMQPSDDEPGTYELVLFADKSTTTTSALSHNMPGVSEYRTKDLFIPHPKKPNLWRYHARRDDIIVLSNGEKFNPLPMEMCLQSHALLIGVLIVGNARSQATLFVEPKPDITETERVKLVDLIWPKVEDANKLVPAQGVILRSNVLVAPIEKPFIRTGKGTVVRRLTEERYKVELDALYAADSVPATARTPPLLSKRQNVFDLKDVTRFVRRIIEESCPEVQEAKNEDSLLSYGLDSVKIIAVVSHLKAELKKNSLGNLSWVTARNVYRTPTIDGLSDVVFQFLNKTIAPPQGGDLESLRVAEMDRLLTEYAKRLPSKNISGKNSSLTPAVSNGCVALIGSTGYLGPYVTASLLSHPGTTKIYCLNRGTTGKERTEDALEKIAAINLGKEVQYVTMHLEAPRLGLTTEMYNELAANVDTIVYNSWHPDFSAPLKSFEPFLEGLQNLIEWSAESPRTPRIVLFSSISAVGNSSKVFPQNPKAAERIIDQNSVALEMGYGESKLIAERILANATQHLGIPSAVARIGQIGGPRTTENGKWAVQGWIHAIVKTSATLGLVPTHVAPVDWLPVQDISDAIATIACTQPNKPDVEVFNLVHPSAQPWSIFVQTLIRMLGPKAKPVSLPQWLEKVEEAYHSGQRTVTEVPAIQLLDFFKGMGDGGEGGMKFVTKRFSGISHGRIEPLTPKLLERWIDQWEVQSLREREKVQVSRGCVSVCVSFVDRIKAILLRKPDVPVSPKVMEGDAK